MRRRWVDMGAQPTGPVSVLSCEHQRHLRHPAPLRGGRQRCALHSEAALDHGACCGSSVAANGRDQLLTSAGPGFDTWRGLPESSALADAPGHVLTRHNGRRRVRRPAQAVCVGAGAVVGLGSGVLWMLCVGASPRVHNTGAAQRLSYKPQRRFRAAAVRKAAASE